MKIPAYIPVAGVCEHEFVPYCTGCGVAMNEGCCAECGDCYEGEATCMYCGKEGAPGLGT